MMFDIVAGGARNRNAVRKLGFVEPELEATCIFACMIRLMLHMLDFIFFPK